MGPGRVLRGAGFPTEARRLRHVSPNGGFRRDFAYSNLMYILAGEALARAFGGGWERALADRITGPLGMRNTLAGEATGLGREASAPENAARPHVRLDDSLLVATTPRTHVGPAGGIRSSAEDLTIWMRFHLEAGGEVAAMREPRTPLPVEAFGAQYARSSRLSYGSGWFVSDYAGRPMVDHIGGHGGMVANVTLLPEEGIGVAVLTNHGDNLLPVAVTYRILDILLGLDPRPWNRTMIDFWDGVRAMRDAGAEAPGGARVEDAPSRLPAADYGGRYASPVYGDLDVEWDGEALRLRYGAGLHGRLSHWHHDTFRVAWADPAVRAILGRGFVSFGLDMAGRPSGLTMTGFQGERVEAPRVGDDASRRADGR
ncbi:MAG TPA: serine hydrolase [Longimicrobiales bacterium]|nr:serine hydrolase [Longimicrobiales bacterium]